MTFAVQGLDAGSGATVTSNAVFAGEAAVAAIPIGVRDNYSGPELGFSLGLLFGRGRHP